MPLWALIVVVACVVAVTIALVPALVALRRAGERADRVLATAERDLGPLLGDVQALVRELRGLSQEARDEVKRVGALTERAEHVAEGLGRLLTAVSGLTRAGQLMGVAAGLKTGIDVFLHRLRKHQGDDHE